MKKKIKDKQPQTKFTGSYKTKERSSNEAVILLIK